MLTNVERAIQSLLRDEDGELRKALDHFHKMVKEGEGAVPKANLVTTVCMKETLQDQEAKLHRDELLYWLSSLNFAKKQEDVFSKCHPGTGQWLLMANEFQAWFNGDRSSMFWCAGIRKFEVSLISSVLIRLLTLNKPALGKPF